jgi:hypothetical protein
MALGSRGGQRFCGVEILHLRIVWIDGRVSDDKEVAHSAPLQGVSLSLPT